MQVPRSGGNSASGSSSSDDDKHMAPSRQRPPSRVSPANPAPLGAADAAEPGARLAGSFAEDGKAPAAGAPPAGLCGSRRGNGAAAAAAALRKRLLKRGAARALAPAADAGEVGDADADESSRSASRAAEQPAPAGSPAGSGSDSGGAAPALARKQLLKRKAAGAVPPAALASEMEDADAADIQRPGAGAGEQPPGAGSPSALVAGPRMRAGRTLSSSEEDSDTECSGRGDPKRRVPAVVSKRARHAPADGEVGSARSPCMVRADPADTPPSAPSGEDMAVCARSGRSADATRGCHSGTSPAHSSGKTRAEAHSPGDSGVARKRRRSSKLPNKRPRSGAAAPGRSSPGAGSGPVDGRLGSDPQAAAAVLPPNTHHAAPMDLGVKGGSDGGGAGGSQDGNAAAARDGSVLFALQRSSTTTPDAGVARHDSATADALPLADSGVPEQHEGGAGGAVISSAPAAGTPGEDAALDDEAGRLLRGLNEEAEVLWQARDENQAPRNTPGCDAPVLRSACLLQQAISLAALLCNESVSGEMIMRAGAIDESILRVYNPDSSSSRFTGSRRDIRRRASGCCSAPGLLAQHWHQAC